MFHIDTCTGIAAGFPLAAHILHQEGLLPRDYTLGALCEIDPQLLGISHHRFPDAWCHDDVRTLANAIAPTGKRIGLLTGSPPCQPFSIQGLQEGAADERDCFPALLQLIERLRPKAVVLENVPNLLNCPFKPGFPRGSYFSILRGALSELGYYIEHGTFSSGWFGAKFERRRLLLVAKPYGPEPQKQGSAAPWHHEAGASAEKVRLVAARRGLQPGVARGGVCPADWLEPAIGTPSGCGVVRLRRAALGNSLDWRVAALGLLRVAGL